MPGSTRRNHPSGRCDIKRDSLLAPLVLAQTVLALNVLRHFATTAGGERIAATSEAPPSGERIAVLVPVLDEYARLAPCLDGLIAQGHEVAQILVVDGGSVDGTPDLVRRYSARDARVCLLDASPVPADWNGKAWGLYVGAREVCPDVTWVLTVDADVRPAPLLARSLLAHARRTGLAAFSVATRQEVANAGEAWVHAALLTTLVYRFGLPGGATSRVRAVQANGQCFLVRRDVLHQSEALAAARASPCEDVTMARHVASLGWPVGFYESDDLAWVKMYADGRDVWRNWPRSLPLRDQYAGASVALGLAEVALVQALPLPFVASVLALRLIRRTAPRDRAAFSRPRQETSSAKDPARSPNAYRVQRWLLALNLILALARLGVLVGTARAYRRVLWSYWLSPLCDLPAAARLCASAARRRHTWRGRVLVSGGDA